MPVDAPKYITWDNKIQCSLLHPTSQDTAKVVMWHQSAPPPPVQESDQEHDNKNSFPTSSRHFVTSLIDSIHFKDGSENELSWDPLASLTAEAKQIFLTLHVLFPSELLAALDLLDRGLVSRFTIQDSSPQPGSQDPPIGKNDLHQIQTKTEPRNLQPGQSPDLVQLRPQYAQGPPPQHVQKSFQSAPPQSTNLHADADSAQEHYQQHQVDPQDTSRINQQTHLPISKKDLPAKPLQQDSVREAFYYVRSAQEPRHKYHPSRHNRHASNETPSHSRYMHDHDNSSTSSTTTTHITNYEVRLQAWSCSCPAFIFSAFPARSTVARHNQTSQGREGFVASVDEQDATKGKNKVSSHSSPWIFGGLTRGTDLAVCKHLLACVLAEHGHAFAHMVEHRQVSVEELAGWAAGWGDGW